jgi:ribulose-phosphate 3-epimerase
VENLFPYLGSLDYVLIMSVFAGFGGQKFIEGTLDRIRTVKREIRRRKLNVLIEVDGGIGPNNAPALSEAGADILVAGSSVFKAPDPDEAIRYIRVP